MTEEHKRNVKLLADRIAHTHYEINVKRDH